MQQTEAFISWSFPELYEMYAITGFLVECKNIATNKWRQFNITRKESHSLTNLEEDTAYLVRLRSRNEFGPGILSEILGLRTSALGKKEGRCLFCCRVVLFSLRWLPLEKPIKCGKKFPRVNLCYLNLALVSEPVSVRDSVIFFVSLWIAKKHI